ncbi:hypothetical protein SCOCK_230032 [Actinacidiphila cocklensis]|uniref:Uncharacterized protein n=1 Tax=Actinacidiphila cocklensis TaxID=887465 RepID=A0A9W4GR43_9ACTN|nr:hypothetical protein SCOCK_230032 [Actinacidiphila cocklensis]
MGGRRTGGRGPLLPLGVARSPAGEQGRGAAEHPS